MIVRSALVILFAVVVLTELGCSRSGVVPVSTDAEIVAVGMKYREAREILLREGWLPQITSVEGPDGPEREWLVAGDFLALGFVEIELCSGTGLNPCVFNFTRKTSECLRVITQGEPPDAEVAHIDEQCTGE